MKLSETLNKPNITPIDKPIVADIKVNFEVVNAPLNRAGIESRKSFNSKSIVPPRS